MTVEATASENRAQRRASRTRSRLTQAALAMFARKGVGGTTIEDITEQADVGKGTFYRHFASKEALLEAILEQSLSQLVDRLRGSSTSSPGSLSEVLNNLLEAHAGFCKEHPSEFALVFLSRGLAHAGDGATIGQPSLSQYLAETASRLGVFLPSPPDPSKMQKLAMAIAGFVNGYYSLSVVGMTPQEIESSLRPLRQAFVAQASVFLSGQVR